MGKLFKKSCGARSSVSEIMKNSVCRTALSELGFLMIEGGHRVPTACNTLVSGVFAGGHRLEAGGVLGGRAHGLQSYKVRQYLLHCIIEFV